MTGRRRRSSTARLALAAGLALSALLAGCSGDGGDGGDGGGSSASATASRSSAAASSPSEPATSASTARGALPDVPTYHQDARRTGRSPATPAPGDLAVAWSHDLDGEVYAQPLVVHGTVLVATEDDSVYAFDATTGAQRWRHHLATPQDAAALPCGDIDPTAGVTGTPVYDAASDTLMLVADEAGPHHVLYGLDPATGATRWSVGADVPGSDPRAEQQRGALAVSGGQVYVTYGALAGDCSDYHGEVVTATTAGKVVATLSLPTRRGGGIWAPSGPTVGPDGSVYVTSANSAARPGDRYEDSNGTLRLSPTLQVLDSFAPRDWVAKDAADLGLGSTGPTLLDDGLIVAAGKDEPDYVLDSTHLGGVGGQLASSSVCAAYGGTAHVGDTVFLPCTSGLTAVTASRTGLVERWRASSSVLGAPVVGGGAVFALDQAGGVLHAVAQSDGHELGSVHLPDPTTRFATPALSGSWAFVGTTKGIVAVSGA